MEAANGQIQSTKQHDFFRIRGLRHMMTSSISLLWPWGLHGLVFLGRLM
uniref:Uncharacterized protein n=1 Tax=Arundo donax TaxID=35708 RepID=A0A0A9F2X0_ARUDO